MTQINNESKAGIFADVVAAIDNIKMEVQKEPSNLLERLNQMIASGASFDASTDDFQIIAENLPVSEKEYLTTNHIAVLCALQQALLMKHLFSAKPLLLKTYIAEVNDQDARFETVCEITGKWFARLLETNSR